MDQDRTADTIRRTSASVGSIFTTDRAGALIAIGALALLAILRLGFRGALGD